MNSHIISGVQGVVAWVTIPMMVIGALFFAVGAIMGVMAYQEGKPLDAVSVEVTPSGSLRVDTFMETWFLPIFFAGFGLCFMVIPGIVYMAFRRTTKAMRHALAQQSARHPDEPSPGQNTGVTWT